MLILKTGWVFCKKEKETCTIIVQFLEQEICKCNCIFCLREKCQTDNCHGGEGNGAASQAITGEYGELW